MAQEQVNVRVSAEVHRILNAAAWVSDVSIGELVRAHVEEFARQQAEMPGVQTALRARAEAAAARDNKLTPLESKRRSRRQSGE